jgi:hypothetical protein
MTHYPQFMGNKKIGAVIPAACLAILTLVCVSYWGSSATFMVPAILGVLIVTITLIITAFVITS